MNVSVHHSLPGRLRLHYNKCSITSQQALLALSLIAVQDGILFTDTNRTVGSFLICYDPALISKKEILCLFAAMDNTYLTDEASLKAVSPIPEHESIFAIIAETLFWHFTKKVFLPQPLKLLLLYKNIIPRIFGAIFEAVSGTFFSTNLLDATALSVSVLTGDINTASTISMLLNLGDDIEEVTKKRSYENLAQSLLVSSEPAKRINGNTEESVSVTALQKGDRIIVRQGLQIPVDGTVESGHGMVNEAGITGEPLPKEKRIGSTVFAGTLLEEGELIICVRSVGTETKVQNIIALIDNSQNLKAQAQKRSEAFAERIVPFNFLFTALTWFFTRNITKTISTLMVDYSCAMKLSAPIAVFSAMQEASEHGIIVKGGKYLEEVATAPTVLFDKTGTLTFATPYLVSVHPFNGISEEEVLTLAACLEEHFPHPLGRAVVEAAKKRGLDHPEYHTKVEYIVAHGIASSINQKKTCIGSAHFIFEDEGVPLLPEAEKIRTEHFNAGHSLLYISLDGALIGILAIGDPIRPEAKAAITRLKELGVKKCIMVTGDTKGAAQKIASEAQLDSFYAEALPEDKVSIVEAERKNGRVIMLGDGINDAPALGAAEVGISVDGCSSIASDTADINLSSNGLLSLVTARELGQGLLKKILENNQFIIGFNSLLIFAGVFGFISPTLAAVLHNSATIGISIKAMQKILPEHKQ